MNGVTYNHKSILEKYDSTPTTNSSNLVNSGVVKQYVDYEVADIRSDVDYMIDRVGNPFVFKGTKATISALPSSGNTINDCWFVEETGFIYCWNGTAWSKASTDVNNQLAHCIAEEYSDQKVYKQGELVIYNNAVYVRKSDATTQEGTFVSANWTQTNIGNQLYEEVTNLKSAIQDVNTAIGLQYANIGNALKFISGAGINADTGFNPGSSNYSYTDFIDISGYRKIIYPRIKLTNNPTTKYGIAFYSSNNADTYLVGERSLYMQSESGYVYTEIDVPNGANYIRICKVNAITDILYLKDPSVPTPNAINNNIDTAFKENVFSKINKNCYWRTGSWTSSGDKNSSSEYKSTNTFQTKKMLIRSTSRI